MKWFMVGALMLVGQGVAAAQVSEERYFGNLKPTPEEQAAMRALETNRPRGGPASTPIIGEDKSIRFVYGASLPVIICAPLQVCDIELEPGEEVRNLQVGDSVRWIVEPAVTGVPPQEVQHVIVKPADAGLRTSLVVTTDRRTYRMRLTSDEEKYMAAISFAYPDSWQSKWRTPQRNFEGGGKPSRRERRRSKGKAASAGTLEALSCHYELEEDSPAWKPTSVCNDGLQTVIEFPFAVRQSDSPILVVVRAEGGLFTDDDIVQVNFRPVGPTKWLVDTVFDVADLVIGVGTTQQKVRIRRTK